MTRAYMARPAPLRGTGYYRRLIPDFTSVPDAMVIVPADLTMDQTQVVRMARPLLSTLTCWILTCWMLTCWHTGALVKASRRKYAA